MSTKGMNKYAITVLPAIVYKGLSVHHKYNTLYLLGSGLSVKLTIYGNLYCTVTLL